MLGIEQQLEKETLLLEQIESEELEIEQLSREQLAAETPTTLKIYNNGQFQQKLTYYTEGKTVHFELWGGSNGGMQSISELTRQINYFDEDGTELSAILACGFTNAEWIEGMSAADPAADWSKSIAFNNDEWGDAIQA